MEISERIGETSSRFEEEVTPSLVRQFAEAVGSSESELAPPTLCTRWRRGEFELFEKLGIPLAKILHGEQSYEFFGPVRPGTRVSYSTLLKDVVVKKGRKTSLSFLTFETAVNGDGGKLAVSRTTIVVRGGL